MQTDVSAQAAQWAAHAQRGLPVGGRVCVGEQPGAPLAFSSPPSRRHLKEISELQSQQKQEIEALYRRLGKPLPANLGLFHTAPPAGRRRKASKSKLKAGRLLSPLVQQLKVVASSTGGPCALLAARGRGARPAAGGWEAGALRPAWVGEERSPRGLWPEERAEWDPAWSPWAA